MTPTEMNDLLQEISDKLDDVASAVADANDVERAWFLRGLADAIELHHAHRSSLIDDATFTRKLNDRRDNARGAYFGEWRRGFNAGSND